MHPTIRRIIDLQLCREYTPKRVNSSSSSAQPEVFEVQSSIEQKIGCIRGFRYPADLKTNVTSTHDYIRFRKHKILIAYLTHSKKKTKSEDMSEQIRHVVTSDRYEA